MTQSDTREEWAVGDTITSSDGWQISETPTREGAEETLRKIGHELPERGKGIVFDVFAGACWAIWHDDEGAIFELSRPV